LAAEAPFSAPPANTSKISKNGRRASNYLIMPYRKVEFVNDEIYHTILRGIDGNVIFKDINDYYRGIFSIYEFNNAKPVSIQEKRNIRNRFKKSITKEIGRPTSNNVGFVDTRDILVDILAFCFMPNHIHLLLKQVKEDGIHNFMVKLGSGYGRYFNQKNQRKGYVFQNRFQSVHMKDDNQLRVAVNYIHANPISIIEPNFKEQGIKNHSADEVFNFLKEDYKWSSFPDYVGVKNFPSVTERNFISDIMGGEKSLIANITDWILYKKELSIYENMLIK